jgi:glycosyltransferase involved in cell wall biosynthesis
MPSIVVPTLNEKNYLPRLPDCLRLQNFTDLETIITDANSAHGTQTVAVQPGYRIVPGGRPAQRSNAGARWARGDYLLFLDADVTVDPGFL